MGELKDVLAPRLSSTNRAKSHWRGKKLKSKTQSVMRKSGYRFSSMITRPLQGEIRMMVLSNILLIQATRRAQVQIPKTDVVALAS